MTKQPGNQDAGGTADVLPIWIDREVLTELYELERSGDPGLVQSLLDGFRETGPTELALIRDAVAQGNAGELQRVAHRFKGTAANLGARVVAERCLALERLGRMGTVEGGNDLADELTKEYNHTISVLLELEKSSPWNRESPKPNPEALS